MRQDTRTIYTFDELSDDAKKVAIQKNMPDELFWADEMLDSVRAFCNLFNATLKDWQLSAYDRNYFESDADASNFRGYTLKQAESIPEFLTGYCLDCTLTETFKKEFKLTGNALLAFIEALDEAAKVCKADFEDQCSDEYIAEHLACNGYEFTEDGVRV